MQGSHRVDFAQREVPADSFGCPAADEVGGAIQPVGPRRCVRQVDRVADDGIVATLLRADAA
jgi:hypothetical protein